MNNISRQRVSQTVMLDDAVRRQAHVPHILHVAARDAQMLDAKPRASGLLGQAARASSTYGDCMPLF